MNDNELENYINQNWTLVFGEDIGYTGNHYEYIEIKEFPNFVYCAPTKEIALANYKNQLKLTVKVMLEFGDKLPNPGEFPEED
ncbi:hypothetical protein IJE86_07220 [bacterium]|nr:hypothetical protein [bacterium]